MGQQELPQQAGASPPSAAVQVAGYVPPQLSEVGAVEQAGAAAFVQQSPLWQAPFAGHDWQAPPPSPHAWSVVPGWQAWFESQQPVQLPVAHVPPQPSSAPAHLPAQSALQIAVHAPCEQLSFPGHAVHVPPAAPQAAVVLPLWHAPVESQQPAQEPGGGQ